MREVQSSAGRELILKVERDGLVSTKRITPKLNEETGTYLIGIHAPFQVVTFGPIESIAKATERTWDYSILTLTAIGEIITGSRSLDDMGGPVKIVDMSNQVAQKGRIGPDRLHGCAVDQSRFVEPPAGTDVGWWTLAVLRCRSRAGTSVE